MVLQLYYVEELNLDEIGEVLGVGAARVWQIKKAALNSMSHQLVDWMDLWQTTKSAPSTGRHNLSVIKVTFPRRRFSAENRRVGTERDRQCSFRWWPDSYKKNHIQKQ